MAEGILYAVVCAGIYAFVSTLASCKGSPEVQLPRPSPEPGMEKPEEDQMFVRFNCDLGEYNPVASLLLTTSEGAVKRLFSRTNTSDIHMINELVAFLAYSLLNICLTGVPVPSGNFTGSMLIGGLAGRFMGALVRDFLWSYFWTGPPAVSGVYAMIGAAAMLSGFKQMAVAVVVFITGCANDPNLIPPLMLSVTVALLLNQYINERMGVRGFDEEQIMKKNIPFLPPEEPEVFEVGKVKASDLLDALPEDACLGEWAGEGHLDAALKHEAMHEFPILRATNGPSKGRVCMGFVSRPRLQAALDSLCDALPSVTRQESSEHIDEEEPHGRQLSEALVRHSVQTGRPLKVSRLKDGPPHTLLETMPASQFYPLFAKAGVRVAAVISESGEFRGMISRVSLISQTRKLMLGQPIIGADGNNKARPTSVGNIASRSNRGAGQQGARAPDYDGEDCESTVGEDGARSSLLRSNGEPGNASADELEPRSPLVPGPPLGDRSLSPRLLERSEPWAIEAGAREFHAEA